MAPGNGAIITSTASAQAATIGKAIADVTNTFWKPVNGTALRFAGGFLAWVFLWWILIFFVMAKAAIYAVILTVLILALGGVLTAGAIMRPAERRRDENARRQIRAAP